MIQVLPGMGADHRMYRGPWLELNDTRFHDWPDFENDLTLGSIASAVIKRGNIRTGDIIVGSSLGGMVACEIANQISVDTVILIGSAQSSSEISSLLEILHPLIDLTPISFVQKLSGKVDNELTQSFHDADPRFIRATCRAIFDWEGCSQTNNRVRRIHGNHDLVIPRPKQVDLLLPAGHLVAVSHPAECVKFVRDLVNPTV